MICPPHCIPRLPNNRSKDDNNKNEVSVVGNDWVVSSFSWIPKYVYGKDYEFTKFYTSIESERAILVVDRRFINTIMNINEDGIREDEIDPKNLAELRNIYNKSDLVAKFTSKRTEPYNFDKYPVCVAIGK